jgi:hypothetical protein
MRLLIIGLLGAITLGGFAQNQKVTFMTYNLMYFRASSRPCTPTQNPTQRTAELSTIMTFAKPDILLVNELGSTPTNGDFILSNVLNINGVNKYNKAAYSNNNFSSIVNMLFFDSTLVDLVAQDRIEEDLNGDDLVRVLDVYTLYYKDPALVRGADTTYLTIVGLHLKAGDAIVDQFERKDAADALMSYLSTRFKSKNILVAGDMNLYKNTEPAYQTFTAYADTSVRLYDPINMPGNWNNNSNFAAIHTQSTHASSSGCHSGGGGDDRFDFILASNAVMQGSKGLSYLNNSYKTLGQDGLHFNQSINANTNSSAPSAIIEALYNFSDHLPVYASFNFRQSNIGLKEHKQSFQLSFNNPIETVLSVNISGANQGPMSLDIVDLSGRTVFSTVLGAHEREKRINCGSWYNGLYLLRVSDLKGNTITRKFIKH